MPAIQPARLKLQVASLGEYFARPELFVVHLHELMDFYTDRTRRSSKAGGRVSLLPHYNIAGPVMRQIEEELTRQTEQWGPQVGLDLADALWQDGFYESRLFAAHLVGACWSADIVQLTARIRTWVTPDEDDRILQALFAAGKASIGRNRLDIWLDLIRSWLSADSIHIQELGIRALCTVVDDPEYENLPPIFILLGPVVQSAPTALHPNLVQLTSSLARRSPAETAYFLRRMLAGAQEPSITRLIRRCLPAFPPELQTRLRDTLLERARN
jgi:hypothetical protein